MDGDKGPGGLPEAATQPLISGWEWHVFRVPPHT